MERLNIAETARFELQKMLSTVKEKLDEHISTIDERFDDSKMNVDNIQEEFHKIRDNEITKIQVKSRVFCSTRQNWDPASLDRTDLDPIDLKLTFIQVIDDKHDRLENRLTEFENEREKLTTEVAGLSERDEITKKNVSKLFSRVDELDEKVEQVMSGFGLFCLQLSM